MNILILADKYQKRMKSKGCVGLIKVNNKHIITHQYQTLKNTFPDSQIIYIHGFDSKRLLSHIEKNNKIYKDLHLIYNKNYENYNSAYSISLAKDFLNEDCMILFGDNIIKSNAFNHFNQTRNSQIFIQPKHKSKLGCVVNSHKIESISYDLDNYLSEVYFVSKQDIDKLKSLINNKIYYNYFVFEIINKMIDLNCNISPCFITYKPTTLSSSL